MKLWDLVNKVDGGVSFVNGKPNTYRAASRTMSHDQLCRAIWSVCPDAYIEEGRTLETRRVARGAFVEYLVVEFSIPTKKGR